MTASEKTKRAFFEAVRNNRLNQVAEFLAEDDSLARARMRGDATLLNGCVFKNKTAVPMTEDDNRNATALHFAAFYGHVRLAEILLDYGADINAMGYENNHEQTTPLILAAWEGGQEMLQLLLDYGADPNARSSNGVTPLATAKRHQHQKHVDLLIQYGACQE